ncbi:hypothetical protein KUTeg_021954 [Tegillarca granosa]|uniref:Nucleoporin Nup159/Nup146 N-terminal domain-containing protein n=1 Tax=Tegillarca granosa TaxID=220873 RepID=A0ABQ9EAE0_TEGGR|nr:hypothetical protein KUTeg_021954 [Tegillarca granosa]
MAEERDVQDFRFQQLCRFRVFGSPNSLPVSSQQLIAASSKYGLLFVGVEKGLKVIETAQLSLIDDKHASDRTTTIVEKFPVKAVAELPAPTSYIALSCDDLTLAVIVCESENVHALMYDVRVFAIQGKNPEPFTKVRLGGGAGVKPLEIAWNPVQPNTMVACLSDGSVGLYEVTDKLKIFSLPSSTGARCVCWSPKGKQCVLGKRDGTLVQYDPELKKKREWPCPKSILTEGQHTVVGVTWVSTYVFIAAYVAIDADRSVQPTVILITGSKDAAATPTYVNMEDVCYGNGKDRDQKYFFHYIQKWEMVLATSNNACETAIVGKHFDNKGTVWERWCLNDSDRAELPLTEDYSDTFPVGVTVDFSSQFHVPYGENQKHPPAPLLLLLSTDGVIVPYYMIYTHAEAVSLTTPPQTLTPEGVRTKKSGSGSGTVQTDAAPVAGTFGSTMPGSATGSGTKPTTSFQFIPAASSSASPGGLKTGPSFQFTSTAAVSNTTSIGTIAAGGTNTGPSFQFVSKPTTTNLTGPSFSFVSSTPSATTTSKSLFGSGPGLFSSPGTTGTPPATIAGFGLSGSSTPQASTKSSIFAPSTVATSAVASTSVTTTPGLPKPSFAFGTPTQSTTPSTGSSGPSSIFSSAAKPGSGFSFTPTATKPTTGFSFTAGTSNSSGFSFGGAGAALVTTGIESAGKSTTSSAFSFTSSTTNAPVKPSMPQSSTGFPKTEQTASKPDASKPSAFVGFGTAPSATPGGSFLQNLLTSETPGGNNQPAPPGSAGFVTPSKPSPATTEKQSSSAPKTQVSTEVTQPQPLSFNFATTAKSGTATQPSAPTASHLASGAGTVPATAGQQSTRTRTTVGPSTPALAASSSSVPGESSGVTAPGPGLTTPTTPSSTDPLDNTFTKSILEEMAHFEQEISSFKSRAGQNQAVVGTREGMIKIKKQTDDMDGFCQEIRKTTKEQNKEIEEQKSLCLDLHAMIEDCRVREQRNYDPKYEHLLRSRALDPASQEQLRQLQQQFQILDQGLRDVDAILDQEWDDYQNQRKNRSRIRTPSTDQVYRAIKSNRNVIVSQKNKLDDIESQLKQLKIFNRTSAWQQPQSETSTDIRDSELSTLADSLLENSTNPLSSTRISAAGTSPQKEAKLREYLSRRQVPKIKSTRPENLSMSKIVSAEKLKLALRQKEAESDRSTPEEVKSATATKRTIASRSGVRFPSQSDSRPVSQLATNRPQTLAAINRPPAQFTATRPGTMPPAVNANQMPNFTGTRMQRPAGVARLGHYQLEDITPPSSTGYDEDDEEDDDDECGEGFGPEYNIQSTASGTSSQDNTDSETDETGTYRNQLQSGTQVNRSLFTGPPPAVFSVKTTVFDMVVPTTKPSLVTPGITSGVSVSAADSVKIDANSTKGPSFNFGSASPAFTFGGSANKEAALAAEDDDLEEESSHVAPIPDTSVSPSKPSTTAESTTPRSTVSSGSNTGAIGLFGQQTIPSASIFRQGTTTASSLFGRGVSSTVVSGNSIFGKGEITTGATIGGGLFGQSVSRSTTESPTAVNSLNGLLSSSDDSSITGSGLFGKSGASSDPTVTSTSSVENKTTSTPESVQGVVSATTATLESSAGKSVFGQPTSTSTATTSLFGQGLFGKGTGGGLFGQTLSTPSDTVTKGASATGATNSPFGSSANSSASVAGSTVGSSSSTTAPLFGTATTSVTTPGALFGGTTGTANTTPTLLGTTTGTAATTATLFGGTTGAATTAASVFGGTSGTATTTAPLFGGTTTTSASLFGSTTSVTSAATQLFGGTTNITSTAVPLLGGTSYSYHICFFVWGNFQCNHKHCLFGSQASKGFGSTSPSGPFSSGGTGGSFSSGGTGSVAGSGFGVQQQQQQTSVKVPYKLYLASCHNCLIAIFGTKGH